MKTRRSTISVLLIFAVLLLCASDDPAAIIGRAREHAGAVGQGAGCGFGYDGRLGFGVESLLGYVLSSMQNPQDVDGFVIDTEIDAALAVGKRPKPWSYPVA